ncbi:tRNA pseudouridine(38-40) synthase TruA [Sulfuritalea hydrogenivorans]|jgi:tRNA pseudouridine38-40 synthase|uniref:tRNA pseudouridine synthase A n=1 Tax=Sulfuritalea hydrogenivorans sk43H TaxID=1223802 RepID=W0SDT2_9PROT|nr:tRNA pseudouridine(38-40) synthase TruA [Sulfuritalea hydrogenivorans]MDK9713104.1 tRNA pseudouridine(38-40) synthase TruA [Sulfuritalea sp.]BAO29102.1 pseudouridylate synthase I [Sulfuritalea hydrogenivorans sk43H]
MRIALTLEYDGSGFCGWQSQAGGGAVQDALESALSLVADAPIRVACAGRTDAGVHAIGQVVHFDTAALRPDTAWVRGVNSHLPASVAVRWAQSVPDDFHARFSATGRRYRYVLLNRGERPGLMAKRVGWFHRPLDADAMQAAAGLLLGEHDFSAFRAVECQAKSPVKTLRRADVTRHGDLLVFDFEASAFLHHMVRNIVGALVYVGKGAHPPEWVGELLAGRDRARAAPTFEACGLYFAGVDYDPVWQLKVGAGDTALLLP